ncbi:MAG: bifunctional glutamate N-acetyltransferase/amino-acid acetyltransferase ArgJ [Chloroflexi bacterium]|nr:bifunctional glutamate N-acetyltransferase/amino-acid acetyltransferase ArgJ [Chloroflexota bacterium]
MIEAIVIKQGTITTLKGFYAGAISAGLKTVAGALDIGILYSKQTCTSAGMFTINKIKAAPVILSIKNLSLSSVRAIVVNSGCANACTGEQGEKDALEMASLTAIKLGLKKEEVIVASTGVIGHHLPMEKVRKGIGEIKLTRDGGHKLAKAIITTDTHTKEIAVDINGIKIAGIAKGAGMIHPDMATMLCFLTTDALVSTEFLNQALKKAVEVSFNMITVDGDTSTNDSIVILANGVAGIPDPEDFENALQYVCTYLAKSIAGDGEGATRLIEVNVDGASSIDDARKVARTIAASSLLKAAIYGGDPNWGRVLAAAGRSRANLVESKLDLYIDNICLLKNGTPREFNPDRVLKGKEVLVRLCMNLGNSKATAWGCDLTEDYVRINSEYRT